MGSYRICQRCAACDLRRALGARLGTVLSVGGRSWHIELGGGRATMPKSKRKSRSKQVSPSSSLGSIKEAHSDLMRLGEFWKGREAEVFGGAYRPNDVIEPLPGSAEDR